MPYTSTSNRQNEPRDARSPNSAPQDTKNDRYSPDLFSNSVWYMRLLYWLAFCTAIIFAVFNVAPYARAIRLLFANAAVDTGLFEFLGGLPLINGIAGVSGIAAIWILGAILWGLIQACEIFPLFLERNRAFLRGVITDADRHQPYAVRNTDDPFLRNLKQIYNKIPLLAVRNARQSALIAYTVDFCICLTIYPPVEGGFSRMLLVLSTGQWSEIDWLNVAGLLASLFVVEIMCRFMFWLDTLRRISQTTHP